MKMRRPVLAAGTTSPLWPPTAAVSAHPFPPTNHKPHSARIRLSSAAVAISRWVNPRAPPPRRGTGGSGTNQRLHHLVHLGNLDAALLLVESMREPERPAAVHYTLLIKKLCAAGLRARGHRRCRRAKHPRRGVLSRGGRLADAERMLASLAASGSTDVVTYNTLVAGYYREGRLNDARCLVADMPFAPNSYTNSTLLKGLCNNKEWDDAEELLSEMIRSGCPQMISRLVHTGRDCLQ